jgi:hypothetical protein
MMTCVVVVLSRRSSSARVMPISSSELVFRIGATNRRREGSSVWHGPTWTSRGHCDRSSLVVSLVKSESLARGGVMTMTPVSNLGEDPRHMWLCVRCSFGRQGAVCALAAVVFHDGRRGCLYRFSIGFPLINRPALFFLINKNDKSFALFKK